MLITDIQRSVSYQVWFAGVKVWSTVISVRPKKGTVKVRRSDTGESRIVPFVHFAGACDPRKGEAMRLKQRPNRKPLSYLNDDYETPEDDG